MKRRVLCLLLAAVMLISMLPLSAMAAVDTSLKYYMVELSSTSDQYRDSHPAGTYHVMYNDYITLIVFPSGNCSTVPTRQYWSYLSQWEAKCSNLYSGVTIADTNRLVLKFPMTQRVSFQRNPNLVSKDAKFNSSDKVTSGSWTVMTEQKLDMSYMKIQRNAWGEIEAQTYFENDGAQAFLRYSIWCENEDDRSWSVSLSSNVDYKYHSWDTWKKNIKMDGKTMIKNPRMSPYKHNWKLFVDHLDFSKVGHSQQGAISLDQYWYNHSGEGSSGVTTMAWNTATAMNYGFNVSEGGRYGQWLTKAYTRSFPTDNQFVYLSPYIAYSPAKTYSANNFNGSSNWYGPVMTNAMELDISDGDRSSFGTLESWGFTDLYAVGEDEIPDSSEANWALDSSNVLYIINTGSGVKVQPANKLSADDFYNGNMIGIYGTVQQTADGGYEFMNHIATLGVNGVCLTWGEEGYLRISQTGQVHSKGVTLSTPGFTFYSPIDETEKNALTFSWSCPRYSMAEDATGEWEVNQYSQFGLSIGMDHSRSDAEFYLDVPGSSTDLHTVSAVPTGTGVAGSSDINVYFSGTMDLDTSLLSLADLSIQEIQTGYQNGEYTVMGMKASGSVGISDIIGFPTAKAQARINTIDDEVYGFSLEVKIPMLAEIASELELKRLNNGALAPNNLYLFASGPVGIPLVPPVILAELNGAGGGFSNLADTINGDFFAIPPLKLTVTGSAEVLQLVGGKASATLGLGYHKLMLHDPEILGLINLDAYYSETLYVHAQQRDYKGTLYTGLSLGGDRYMEATFPGKKIADIVLLKSKLGMDTFAGVNHSGKTLYLLVDANGAVKGTIQIPTKVAGKSLPGIIAGKKLAGTSLDMRLKAQTTIDYSRASTAIKTALKNAALAASFHWDKEILGHTIAIDVVLNKHVKLSVGVLFDLTDINVTIPLSASASSAGYATFAATGETDDGDSYGLLVSSAEAASTLSNSLAIVPTPGTPKGTSYDVTFTDPDALKNSQLQLTLNGGSYTAEELKSLFRVTDERGKELKLVFAEYDESGNLLNGSASPNAYYSMPITATEDSYAIDEDGKLIQGKDASTDAYTVVLKLPELRTYTITTNSAATASAEALPTAEEVSVEVQESTGETGEATAEPEVTEEAAEIPGETVETIDIADYPIKLMSVSSDAALTPTEGPAETTEETEAVIEGTEAVAEETETVPAETETIPEKTETIPEETETIPEETETIPEETETIPEETETIPEETETAPEENETIPEETEEVTGEELLDEAAAAAAPTFTIQSFTYQPQERIDGGIANLKDDATYVLDLYLVDEDGKAYDYQALTGLEEVILTSSHNGQSAASLLRLNSSNMKVNYLPTGSYSVVYELAKRGALVGEDGSVLTDENGDPICVDIPVAQMDYNATVNNTNPDDLPEVSGITVADVGNEVLRASWTGADNVDGYCVSVQQLSGGIWTDTGAAYEVRDEDGDGVPDTAIDMAITITGVDDSLLLADQSYRVKIHTIRDLTLPGVDNDGDGTDDVVSSHSEGITSGSTTVKAVTPVTLTYTPAASPATDDSGAVTGKILYVTPGQDVIIRASSAADIAVSTNSESAKVTTVTMDDSTISFTVPEFDGSIMVQVDAVDAADGDITREYLSLRHDSIAPVVVTDQQSFRIAPGSTTITITGRTEPGVTLTVDGREYAVAEDGTFSAQVTLGEEKMQTGGTVSINGGAMPIMDENGEPLTDTDGNYLFEDAVITGADNPELAGQLLGESVTLPVLATDRAGNTGTTNVLVQWGVEPGHVHSTYMRYDEENHWTECSCGEGLPPEAHTYDGASCTVCGYDGQLITLESITLPQDYLALEEGETVRLQVSVAPEELASRVRWSVESGSEGIVFVDPDGNVTALGPGPGFVIATVSDGTTTRSVRCRVDVAEPIIIEGVQLGTGKATSELYSTRYAQVEVLLQLPQNYAAAASSDSHAAFKPTSLSIAIESARFTDAAMAELFDLIPIDDRTLAVVPTDKALENPKNVKSSYSGTIAVTVDGQEHITETALKLTVKKSQPKLKATVDAFNAFYTNQSRTIQITGGTVTSIQLNPAVAEPLPQWLRLKNGILTLTDAAPAKNASGKVHLLVQTQEWILPAEVTLSVKSSYKAPGLKLSASSVKLSPDPLTSDGVALQLLPKSKSDTLSSLGVSGLSAPAGYRIENFDPATGAFLLKTEPGFEAGKITLAVSFANTAQTLPLTLSVKTTPVTLKLSGSSATLNTATGDSTVIGISAAPESYRITAPTFRLLDSTGADKLTSGELSVSFQDGNIHIATTAATPDNAKYTLYVSAGGSKEVKATITTVTAEPVLKLKAAGNIDLSFPDQAATVNPTFKNHSGGSIRAIDWSIAETKGKDVLDPNARQYFTLEQVGTSYHIRCTNPSAVNTGSTYMLNLALTLADGSVCEGTVKLPVKRTALKLKLSTSKLTLNNAIDDQGSVTVTCTTKGYTLTQPVWHLMDAKGKESAEGKLDVSWRNGRLIVATNAATESGVSYKLLIAAEEGAAETALTVTIPTEAKSAITTSLKLSGSLDVIRDGTAVTVTPTYSNCGNEPQRTEQLLIYSSADNYAAPVNDLFDIEKDAQGRFLLTRAEGAALDHSLKYRVVLVTTFTNGVSVTSKAANLKLKMGSAKLTLKTEDTFLFANDRNDRVEFTLSSGDAALNGVARVAVKDTKYKDQFQVYDYGNGQYGLGFGDTLPGSKLKSVSITLEFWLEGNETAKSNGTVKLKLTLTR